MIDALRAALPRGELRTDPAARVAYGYDNSRRQAMPDAVAIPMDADEVAALVRVCHEARTPVVARGMGSATTGAAVPVAGGVVVSFERMNRILEVDPANRLLVCEAGALNSDVQRAAAGAGFFWAPDPTSAPYSTVGGNIACNAGGPRAVKYGATRDNVLGLHVVTGTGERLRTGTRTTKSSVGYDFTRLIVGSEGTLALVTEATLKLTPLAEDRATLLATFPDAGAAARAVAEVMAGPVTPCTLEFMDSTAVSIVRDYAEAGLPADAGALLLIECDARTAERAEADLAVVASLARAAGGAVRAAASPAEADALFACRRALSPAQRKLRPDKINEDVAVPVARLPELVRGIEDLARGHGVLIVTFGHAGNGNLHVNLLGDLAAPGEAERMHACLDAVFDLVIALDGTLSGEHGIGHDKKAYIGREIGAGHLALMRAVKDQFDPRGILNPGKVFPDDAAP